jgi:hypothetical protein
MSSGARPSVTGGATAADPPTTGGATGTDLPAVGGAGGAAAADPPTTGGATGTELPAVGGAGGAGGAAEEDDPLRDACETFAEAWCTRVDECQPCAVAANYGNSADCLRILTDSCLAVVTLDHMEAEPADVLSRAEQIREQDCFRAMLDTVPRPTARRGNLELGEECSIGLQCSAGLCDQSAAAVCSCAESTELPEPVRGGPEGASCDMPGYGFEEFYCDIESLTWMLMPRTSARFRPVARRRYPSNICANIRP